MKKKQTARRRISFLSDDHVTRLLRLTLSRAGADEADYIAHFFYPEPVDIAPLRRFPAALREHGDVEILYAGSPAEAAHSSVIVFRDGTIDAGTMDLSPDLQLIQRIGERSDAIDLAAARDRDIFISCMPRRTLAYVAEHVVMTMLALSKRLFVTDDFVRRNGLAAGKEGDVAYNWTGHADIGGLAGRTLGIIGLGDTGVLLARRARAFGMRLLYTKRNRLPREREEELGVVYRELDALLAESHFVSLHASNSAANRALMGRDQFERMRRDAYFINTTRGWLVDEDALYRALTEKRIAGAALDVHAQEPRPARDRFSAFDNVILTPHIAGGSISGIIPEMEALCANIIGALAGDAPIHGRIQ